MQAGARGLRLGLAVLALTSAVAIAGCGSSKTSTTQTAAASTSRTGGSAMAMPMASATCVSMAGGHTVKTGNRVFTLSVGPSETMYSSQQVRRMHPKNGEMMVGGHMQGSGMGTMSGGASMSGMAHMSHLEVHICTRHGNKVVTSPTPTIMMTSGGKTTMVPVAEMEGIGAGMKDFHFGNNVQMMMGKAYTVRVTEGSDHAVFHVTAG